MLPIIIDIEASGLGSGSYPIEVGVVLRDGTPHNYLISPVRGWNYWEAESEDIHGITQQILQTHGRPADEVAWRLNSLLKGKTLYSDSWSYDMSWIGKLYDVTGREQEYKMASLHELLSEEQIEHWSETKDQVTEELALRRQRASGDAKIIQETFRRVQESYPS